MTEQINILARKLELLNGYLKPAITRARPVAFRRAAPSGTVAGRPGDRAPLASELAQDAPAAPTARHHHPPSDTATTMSLDSNRGGGNWGPMGVCPGTIMGADCDSVFAYPTIKYVKIQDARLGLFKYFLMFSILLYGE